MAYTTRNFKTKKALKDAVTNGEQISVYSPGPFPCKTDGLEFVEGPHFPEPHRWYAKVVLVNGYVTKVS